MRARPLPLVHGEADTSRVRSAHRSSPWLLLALVVVPSPSADPGRGVARQAVPLIVFCQCAVVRVVAP
jgi:hypothetical protein